jgi:hypothetical protein
MDSNLIIVWLDLSIFQYRNEWSSRNRYFTKDWTLFDNADKCIDYITSKIEEEKFYLILSGVFVDYRIPLISDLDAIKTVYLHGVKDYEKPCFSHDLISIDELINSEQKKNTCVSVYDPLNYSLLLEKS